MKKSERVKMLLGAGAIFIVCLAVTALTMRKDASCILGRIPYQNFEITDFNGCLFNACELKDDNTIVVTGDDPYIILDSKIPNAIWIRDITLTVPEDEQGISVIKWYWNPGDGFLEGADRTARWNVSTKTVDDIYGRVNKVVYGIRMDLEIIDSSKESYKINSIKINTLSFDELKRDFIKNVAGGILAQIIIVLILVITRIFVSDDKFIVWFIKGVLIEAVYFMLTPVYTSIAYQNKLKTAVVIFNIFISVWIACVGVRKDEYEEE